MSICRDCGADFAPSSSGLTVRCVPCRKARQDRPAAPRVTTAEVERKTAQNVARKARRDFGTDSPEYRAALAEYQRHS